MKVGVGSRVESAEAPVSPRSSPPRLADFRRERGIVVRYRVVTDGIRSRLYRCTWFKKVACGVSRRSEIGQFILVPQACLGISAHLGVKETYM